MISLVIDYYLSMLRLIWQVDGWIEFNSGMSSDQPLHHGAELVWVLLNPSSAVWSDAVFKPNRGEGSKLCAQS